MIRLGLCCIFRSQPIKFRTTTAKTLLSMTKKEADMKISGIVESNIRALKDAIQYCGENGIGAFRINSGILPLKTHPDVSYKLYRLPKGSSLINGFKECRDLAAKYGVRLLFHPGQFVVLNSPNHETVRRSIEELKYQAEVSEWVGADVLNVHGGGVYGDKESALKRLAGTIDNLPENIRCRLTLENDDRSYTPQDLLPICRSTGIPMTYDVHHHRCLPDGLSVENVTQMAIKTWNREPVFHISSPKAGWRDRHTTHHSDYIKASDFPPFWKDMEMTLEIEAKAKELAVLRFRSYLIRKYGRGIVS